MLSKLNNKYYLLFFDRVVVTEDDKNANGLINASKYLLNIQYNYIWQINKVNFEIMNNMIHTTIVAKFE